MGKFVRAFDWANSPLGPMASWSAQLHAAVEHVLNSGLPLLLVWGPEYIQIYNDGFIQFIGQKHPSTLGQNFLSWWPDVGDQLREAIRGAFSGTLALIEDQRLFSDRHGYLEEAFFTYSCSPVHGHEGSIEGLLFSVTETTSKMIGNRRTRALLELSASGLQAQSLVDALVRSAASLRGAELDIPFALFYQIDREQRTARLVASTGLPPGTSASPASVGLNECGWPLAQVVDSNTNLHLDDVQARFPELRAGPYPEPIRSASVQAIVASSGGPGGPCVPVVLVTGMSSRVPLNAAQSDFHELLATTLGHVVASAIAAETRQQQVDALATLNRAKSVFFSNISHEFRTPLSLLLGPIEDELADRCTPLSESRRARLEIAHRNALRLLKLVNALLDFSSFDAKRTKASFEPVDLAALTIDLAGMFRAAFEAAGLALMVDCRTLAEPIFVDREMWEKVVLNLLSNAFKYTFTGGVRVSLMPSGDQVVLEVADTGVGIPAAELPRLFERFHRVRRVRARTQEGSGIGLALVQDIVRLHGGTLHASSEEGKGSCFRVSLRTGSAHLPPEQVSSNPPAQFVRTPAERMTQWLPPPGDPAALADVAAQNEPRPRILWVEDNADLRD
jgi:signal transduction histidine kinase